MRLLDLLFDKQPALWHSVHDEYEGRWTMASSKETCAPLAHRRAERYCDGVQMAQWGPTLLTPTSSRESSGRRTGSAC
jgi:hypothetical protein